MPDAAAQREKYYTVVLGAAHALLRLGVRARLEEHEFKVLAEAETADDVVEAVREHRPDLCLLDVWLPGGGLDAGKRVQEAVPGVALAFLVSHEDQWLLLDVVRSGATGVLFKDMDPERLAHALRDVAQGGTALSRSLVRQLLDELLEPPDSAASA